MRTRYNKSNEKLQTNTASNLKQKQFSILEMMQAENIDKHSEIIFNMFCRDLKENHTAQFFEKINKETSSSHTCASEYASVNENQLDDLENKLNLLISFDGGFESEMETRKIKSKYEQAEEFVCKYQR